jgi:outer membrane receptor protein involved in Fe transport
MSRILTICFILFVGISLVFAQTGKIAGNVLDSDTGEPLVGANVVIVGTTLGAAVDLDGDYYIINIQTGTYTVEASMIGYTTVRQQDVRVSTDKTYPLTFELESTTLETEEIVVVAPRINVKQDVSHSEVTVTEDEMVVVPLVIDVVSYMGLQAGVDIDRDEEGTEMFIRGGGEREIGMVVDGLVMNDNYGGGPIDIVNLSAIEEVSIIRGGFNAEYGNIRSGLFNVVTKEGRAKTGASMDVRYGFPHQKHRGPNLYDHENYLVRPYVDPAVCWVGTLNGGWDEYTRKQYGFFGGWNAWVADYNSTRDPADHLTPEQARDIFIWEHALEGSEALGHPHPGSYGDIPDWNVDLSLHGPLPFISSSLGDLRYFLSYRLFREAYAQAANLEAVTTHNFMGKFNFNTGSNMKWGIEYFYGFTETAGGAAGNYFLHENAPLDRKTNIVGLTFDHSLSNNTFYSVRLSWINTKVDQFEARVSRDTTTIRTIGTYRLDEKPWGFLDTPGFVRTIGDDMNVGIGAGDFNKDEATTINFKIDLTSQVDKYNQVQAGIELIYDDFKIERGNFDPGDPTGSYLEKFTRDPFRIQGYIQDKLEFKDFIANLGLRFDYNDMNSPWYGIEPYNQYFTQPLKDQFEDNIPSEPSEAKFRVSPRLGVAHPITEYSKLFFNYGHFYDLSSPSSRFNIHYGAPSTGIAEIGNPNLKPRKTIAYELGYEHSFADQYMLRLTGYYKDITDQTGEVNYVNIEEDVNYITAENDEFADVRGFEIELRKDWGEWVTGWINYTYMVYTGGLIGREFQFEDPIQQANESKRVPLDDLEKPKPQPYANVNLRVMSPADWLAEYWLNLISINALVTWSTGDYISYPILQGDKVANNLQWNDWWSFDLRISKFFSIDQFEFSLFLDIVNVLDLKYLVPTEGEEEEGGGFENEADFKSYVHSLRLPQYGEGRYANDPNLIAGNDKLGDYRSAEKPYINMPNVDHVAWNRPRSFILGLRVIF